MIQVLAFLRLWHYLLILSESFEGQFLPPALCRGRVWVFSFYKGGARMPKRLKNLEFDVVDENGKPLSKDDGKKWEDAQVACTEAVMDSISMLQVAALKIRNEQE
jgi:hypothetical protein